MKPRSQIWQKIGLETSFLPYRLVRLLDFTEFVGRKLVELFRQPFGGYRIGVVFPHQLAVGLFYLVVGILRADSQHCVVLLGAGSIPVADVVDPLLRKLEDAGRPLDEILFGRSNAAVLGGYAVKKIYQQFENLRLIPELAVKLLSKLLVGLILG